MGSLRGSWDGFLLAEHPEGGGFGGEGVNGCCESLMAAARGGRAGRQQRWEGRGAIRKLNASESISFPTRRAGAVPPGPLLLWLFPKSSQIDTKTPPGYRLVIHTPTFCS